MHANCASILGSIFERFWAHFGTENGAKMDTKFNVFWHWLLIFFFDVSGRCLLFFYRFSHHAMMLFLIKKQNVFCIFVKLHFARSIERAKPNTSKIESNINKKTIKIVARSIRKSIFFWTPFGDAWRPRFWAGFGVDLGCMLEQFWA